MADGEDAPWAGNEYIDPGGETEVRPAEGRDEMLVDEVDGPCEMEIVTVEPWAGVGQLSSRMEKEGFPVGAVCEQIEVLLKMHNEKSPQALLARDFYTKAWKDWKGFLYSKGRQTGAVVAGFPCVTL